MTMTRTQQWVVRLIVASALLFTVGAIAAVVHRFIHVFLLR